MKRPSVMRGLQLPVRTTLGSKSGHRKALSWQPCSQLPSNQPKSWMCMIHTKGSQVSSMWRRRYLGVGVETKAREQARCLGLILYLDILSRDRWIFMYQNRDSPGKARAAKVTRQQWADWITSQFKGEKNQSHQLILLNWLLLSQMLFISRPQQTPPQDSPGRAQILGFITNFKDLKSSPGQASLMFLNHGIFQAVCV